ncbi:probable flavin-containing monoamine oxidase A [Dendronephthya gigantea]|uniref:probable flavin-containing monoamine oxidase A n=1 Tax=Dendronephthya gigantea TaxID=151771 RepID=UPI00106AFEFE|nr:probable flavin-containing monoamine oxidase A [Dendronephthya gigantea]
MEDTYDVIIVGAGAAGLTAAYELTKNKPECKIIVLEARDRIGGRLLSVSLNVKNGGKENFDLGGQWVCSSQKNIGKLIETFKLETYDQYTKGSKLMELSLGEVTSHTDQISSIGFFSSIEMFLALKKIDNMCKEVPLTSPEKSPHAKQWDGTTVETFKNETLWTNNAKRAFDVAVSNIFGLSSSQISLLYFLHYCNSAGGIAKLIDAENGGAQATKVKGGLHQVCCLLKDAIGEEKVLLGHAITKIYQDDNIVRITTSNGKSFESKYCILAIPPKLVGKIEFTPELPYERRILMRQIVMGCYTKFLATYETSFWRESGLSGQLTRFTDNKESVISSPVSLVMDAVTKENNAALVGFFTGFGASHWASKSDDEKKLAVIETLKSFFGSKAGKPLDFAIKDWCQDEWSGGCPVGIMTPGGITQFGDVLRKPCKRIHWAGTEMGSVWRGYVDGAVESGIRTAQEIAKKL